MTALSSLRIYCLDVIKMAKLFTREISHASVNCFSVSDCFIQNDKCEDAINTRLSVRVTDY